MAGRSGGSCKSKQRANQGLGARPFLHVTKRHHAILRQCCIANNLLTQTLAGSTALKKTVSSPIAMMARAIALALVVLGFAAHGVSAEPAPNGVRSIAPLDFAIRCVPLLAL